MFDLYFPIVENLWRQRHFGSAAALKVRQDKVPLVVDKKVRWPQVTVKPPSFPVEMFNGRTHLPTPFGFI